MLKQTERDRRLNPGFSACRGELSEGIAESSSSLHHSVLQELSLTLVPSRIDLPGGFGGKAAVDLMSIPDRRRSSSEQSSSDTSSKEDGPPTWL